MNAYKLILVILLVYSSSIAFSQTKPDSLGLPGDNFDLYGALELFKKADTPENFEKAINANDNEVNNLDLDGDGKVDYVKVIDKKVGDGHTLIMQVAVSQTETQDVAVIEVDKTNTDNAHVQIVGDEELYGKDYIVEPKDETAVKTSTTSQNNTTTDDVYSNNTNSSNANSSNYNSSNNNTSGNGYSSSPTVVVNVWAWPSVQYIYGPSYAPWVSPWYWNTYPMWWQPWQPVYWRYHYRRSYHYHYPYYHRVGYYRSPNMHNGYYGHRTSSPFVRKSRESGFYQQKQMIYKQNVQPGRKYNNQPARRENLRDQNIKQRDPQIRQEQKVDGVKQEKQQINRQETQPVKQQRDVKEQQPIQNRPVEKQQLQQKPVEQRQIQQKPVEQRQIQQKQNAQPRQQSQPQQSQPSNKSQGTRNPR